MTRIFFSEKVAQDNRLLLAISIEGRCNCEHCTTNGP